MAPQDKQERRLARQRGAGPRELQNAAFSFNFGAPSFPPPVSARKTPQPRKSASPRKTPAPRPESSKRKKTTPAPQPARAESARSNRATATPAAVLPADEIDELSPDAPVAIDESELPQLRRVSIPILPLNKAEPRPPPSPDRRPPREERGRSRTRKSIVSVSESLSRKRLDALDEEEEEEDATTGAQTFATETAGVATDATPSSGRQSSRRRTGSVGRRRTKTGDFDGGTSAFLRDRAAQSTARQVFEEPSETTEEDELTPEPTRVSVSRRSTTAEPVEEDSGEMDELTPEPMRVTAPRRSTTVEPAEEESAEIDELTPVPAKTSRPRRSDIEVLPDADAEGVSNEDQDELSPQQDAIIDDSITSVRTPLADRGTNAAKRPRPQADKPTREAEEATTEPVRKKQKITTDRPAKKTYGGPTIPITIYRRTKLAEDDPLGIDPDPVPSLQAPDVLSQISTEVINAYIANVPSAAKRSQGSQSKQTTKKTMRYQMQALQQFRDNLADSLRNITFAQHSFCKFGSEVRKAKKTKRELREELMTKRRERERIEIEIDKVRAEHLREEREHEKQRSLVSDIEEIENAVKRAREEAAGDNGLGANVAADAQDVASRLGVLKRVKEFNAFLARTAEAL